MSADPLINAIAGGYRIVSLLSVGGMGSVYRAEHQMIGRPAAIKVLLPEMSSNRDMVTRFFNEAKATTAIKHPGIVEVFDFGYLPTGQAFIVMELLDGQTLAQRARATGPMREGEAAMLLRSVCGGLAAAHATNVVHRDLKPDNIFLVADPGSALGLRCKLLDFGIAKLTAVGAANSMTKTGAVMGTPTYMSPEQCKGSGDVDARADLYSLGCIFYELVTGRPPFVCEGAGEMLGSHLFVEPDPPSRYAQGLTRDGEALILHMLEKLPSKRVQTAKELAARLGALAQANGWTVPALDGEPSEPLRSEPRPVTASAPDERTQIAALPTLEPPEDQHEDTVRAAKAMPEPEPPTQRHPARDLGDDEETQAVSMRLPDDYKPVVAVTAQPTQPMPSIIGNATEPMTVPPPGQQAQQAQPAQTPAPQAVPIVAPPGPAHAAPQPQQPPLSASGGYPLAPPSSGAYPMPVQYRTPGPMAPYVTPGPMAPYVTPGPMAPYVTPGPMAPYVTPGPRPAYVTPPPMAAYVPTPTTLSGAAREAAGMAPRSRARKLVIVAGLALIAVVAGGGVFFAAGGSGSGGATQPAAAPVIDAALVAPPPPPVPAAAAPADAAPQLPTDAAPPQPPADAASPQPPADAASPQPPADAGAGSASPHRKGQPTPTPPSTPHAHTPPSGAPDLLEPKL